MSLAEDFVDSYDDLCPHGKIICAICAREEEIEDEDGFIDDETRNLNSR